MSNELQTQEYVVKQGDSLARIAREFGSSVERIANQNDIEDPNLILVGQRLQVPRTEPSNGHDTSSKGCLRFLFVDKALRAIPNLRFVLRTSSDILADSLTDANGLSGPISNLAPGETLTLLVQRARGGLKEIYSTAFEGGDRIITAYSPALMLRTSTEPHEGSGGARSERGHPIIRIDHTEVALDFLVTDTGERIDQSDYEEAARVLGCEVAAIQAVAQAETGSMGSFFDLQGWDSVPSILYERHYFHRLTGGAHDVSHPDISDRRAGAGGRWSDQYRKLLRAYALDEEAALKSASWSKFQIMGANHVAAGHQSVRGFVRSASESEKNHLRMFVAFISADPVLQRSLVGKDWLAFARRYNGPAQRGYDSRMKENYDALVRLGTSAD